MLLFHTVLLTEVEVIRLHWEWWELPLAPLYLEQWHTKFLPWIYMPLWVMKYIRTYKTWLPFFSWKQNKNQTNLQMWYKVGRSLVIKLCPTLRVDVMSRVRTNLVCFVAKIVRNGYLFFRKSLNMGTYFWKNYPWTWVWVLSCWWNIPNQSISEYLPPTVLFCELTTAIQSCLQIANFEKQKFLFWNINICILHKKLCYFISLIQVFSYW